MTTKAHSTLTGADLHEPKGIAAAAANKVYVSDGAGSGTWQKITASELDGTGNAFGTQYLYFQEQQTAGTNGGTFTSGAWRTRLLNTSVQNEIAGASLASNQITLPAGTFYIQATAHAYAVDQHQVRFYNITDASVVATGFTAYASSTYGGFSQSEFVGYTTIATSKVFELQHQCTTTKALSGFGLAGGFTTEIYSDIAIVKIA